jgi:hypothetical protein
MYSITHVRVSGAWLTCLVLTAWFRSAGQGYRVVSSDDVRDACKNLPALRDRVNTAISSLAKARRADPATRATADSAKFGTERIIAFCGLTPPGKGDNQAINAWNRASVPTAEDIFTLKAVQPGTSARGFNPNFLIASGGSTSGATSLLTQGILGYEQFVATRASQEVNSVVVIHFANELCTTPVRFTGVRLPPAKDDSSPRARGSGVASVMLSSAGQSKSHKGNTLKLLPDDEIRAEEFFGETCGILRGGASREPVRPATLPAWSVVHSALQRDMIALPDSVAHHLGRYAQAAYASQPADTSVWRFVEKVVLAQGALRFAGSYTKDHNVVRSFTAAGTALLDATASLHADSVIWKELPIVSGVLASSQLVASLGPKTLSDARGDDADNRIDADTAALYALKAFVMNVVGNGSCPSALPSFDAVRMRFGGPNVCSTGARNMPLAANSAWEVLEPATAIVLAVDSTAHAAQKLNDTRQLIVAYSAAVADLLPAFVQAVGTGSPNDSLRVARAVAVAGKLARIAGSRASADYGDVISEITLVVGTIGFDQLQQYNFPPAVQRTLIFAADMATAQNAADFEDALNRAAAPLDAWSRKRVIEPGEANYFVTLNAYFGGASGLETAQGHALPHSVKALSYGLYVPLGLEVGWRQAWPFGWPFSFLFQVADVGQVASWRSTASDTLVKANPPAFTLSNVVSPGVFAIAHTRRWPVSIGIGYSFAPRFREVTALSQANNPANPARADVQRVSLFVAADVPLFP